MNRNVRRITVGLIIAILAILTVAVPSMAATVNVSWSGAGNVNTSVTSGATSSGFTTTGQFINGSYNGAGFGPLYASSLNANVVNGYVNAGTTRGGNTSTVNTFVMGSANTQYNSLSTPLGLAESSSQNAYGFYRLDRNTSNGNGAGISTYGVGVGGVSLNQSGVTSPFVVAETGSYTGNGAGLLVNNAHGQNYVNTAGITIYGPGSITAIAAWNGSVAADTSGIAQ